MIIGTLCPVVLTVNTSEMFLKYNKHNIVVLIPIRVFNLPKLQVLFGYDNKLHGLYLSCNTGTVQYCTVPV